MAETTADGRIIHGHPGDVKGEAVVPGSKDVLENSYNDFIDAKELGQIAIGLKFSEWIKNSIDMLEGHRRVEIEQQHQLGQIGRAEADALHEYRIKLVEVLKKSDLSSFHEYGMDYVDMAVRQLSDAQKRGDIEILKPSHRDIKIKTSQNPGKIIKA